MHMTYVWGEGEHWHDAHKELAETDSAKEPRQMELSGGQVTAGSMDGIRPGKGRSEGPSVSDAGRA